MNLAHTDESSFMISSDSSSQKTPEMIVLRFTRMVFSVNLSPFLLNATVNHHMETYQDMDPFLVDKFLSSIYVDDVNSGGGGVDSTYELYLKSKLQLAEAGFKFITNFAEL